MIRALSNGIAASIATKLDYEISILSDSKSYALSLLIMMSPP